MLQVAQIVLDHLGEGQEGFYIVFYYFAVQSVKITLFDPADKLIEKPRLSNADLTLDQDKTTIVINSFIQLLIQPFKFLLPAGKRS